MKKVWICTVVYADGSEEETTYKCSTVKQLKKDICSLKYCEEEQIRNIREYKI